MKSKVWIGSIMITAALCGCGSGVKTIEGDVAVKETSAQAQEKEQTEAAPEEAENAAAAEDTVQYSGYAFTYDGTVIGMDMDAAPVVEQLGEPDSYFEAPSCAFEGIDKVYTYGSFELDTYPTDNKDYVSSVVFKDDTITTTEGVGIGDPEDKVVEAYGSGWTEEDGMRVYEKDGMKLCFILENDTVASIEYRSTAVEQ